MSRLESIDKTNRNREIVAMEGCRIEIYQGEAVFKLLAEECMQLNWDALYEACPWATVFQSRAFVTTWYQTYRNKYLPIVVKQVEEGRLTGLLTLAKYKSGLIVGSGGDQSEYQVWLATNANEEVFIKKALTELNKHFTKTKIQLKYIPGNVAVRCIMEDSFLKKRCLLKTVKQPLMKTDAARISNELRKKNRREKINRLKRIGELKFEQITEGAVFSSILDELIVQYNFRKMAKYNTAFFLKDPLRKKFLLSLFEHGLLHVTVLRLNEEIIASNVSVTGKNWLHLQGINTHSPSYSKYSPGILHFLMLGRLLADEGIEVLDLTPGGDSYKEGLATDYTLAHMLCVSSVYRHFFEKIKVTLVKRFKKIAAAIGIKQPGLKEIKKKTFFLIEKLAYAQKQRLSFSIKVFISHIRSSKKNWKYTAQSDALVKPSALVPINKNSLGDLLQFEAEGSRMSRWEFLEAAMHRFEVGQSAYTFCEGGRLLAVVWLGGEAVTPTRSSPEEAILLQGVYCHPGGQCRLKAFLLSVAAAVNSTQPRRQLRALVAAQNTLLCHTLEAMGFYRSAPEGSPGERKDTSLEVG
jgi:hypothetical protein